MSESSRLKQIQDTIDRAIKDEVQKGKSKEEIEKMRSLLEIISNLEEHFIKTSLLRFLVKLDSSRFSEALSEWGLL
jgi:hypothetical protein